MAGELWGLCLRRSVREPPSDERRSNLESGGFCEVAGAVVDHGLDRDLIEAGLSEPAGWRASYGDCVCGGRSESPRRTSGAAISNLEASVRSRARWSITGWTATSLKPD